MKVALNAFLRPIPAAFGAAFEDFLQDLTRRLLVIAALALLVALPLIQALEMFAGGGANDGWAERAAVRLAPLLVSVAILMLHVRGTGGPWPRTMMLALLLVSYLAGFGLLLLQVPAGGHALHYVAYSVSVLIPVSAPLATRGARDLALTLLPAVALSAVVLLWMPPLAHDERYYLVYPFLSAGLSFITAELLFRSNVRAFLAACAMEQRAITDTLTDLMNRRGAAAVLSAEHARCMRHGGGYAIAMADIDHFKRVNDTYGHPVGDEVLAALAKRLRDAVRDEDHVVRWGGEEFLVLLHAADEDAAGRIAEKLRQEAARAPFLTDAGALDITISVGVAVRRSEAHYELVVARADEALYAAKQQGRNRVCLG